MSSALKLQINSKDLILELLNKFPDIEIELKRSVIDEVSKKYLKGITDQVCYKYESAANAEVKKIAEEKLGKYTKNSYYSSESFLLSPEVKKSVEQEIDKHVSDLLHDEVQFYVEHLDLTTMIKSYVDRKVDAQVKEIVNAEVKRKMTEIMSQVGV